MFSNTVLKFEGFMTTRCILQVVRNLCTWPTRHCQAAVAGFEVSLARRQNLKLAWEDAWNREKKSCCRFAQRWQYSCEVKCKFKRQVQYCAACVNAYSSAIALTH